MFEYLKGQVTYKKLEYVALDVNGVGYRIYISLRAYEKIEIEKEIKFFIYNVIKEDTFKLVGFLEEKERTLFELLLSVSGIGVSLALSIMSSFSIEEISEIILKEESSILKKVPKLGEKKAKQIILDLKEKVKIFNNASTEVGGLFENKKDFVEEEIYLALEALGYTRKELDKIMKKDEIEKFETIEDAIKGILKKIHSRG
jgi:Holliday junction DNA helicase RuvA